MPFETFASEMPITDWMISKLQQWKKDEDYFVETTACNHVMRCLLNNKCVSVVGPPGIGKTFLVRHVALEMENIGFNVISVNTPNEIKQNYQLHRKLLFVVDDMCGNFTANTARLDKWKRGIEDITDILNNDSCKLILTCREQVFRDEGFKHSGMEIFQTCKCNLLDDELALTYSDKENIAKRYFGRNYTNEFKSLFKYDFFPLLCKFYFNKTFSIQSILKDPFHCYRKELNNLFLDCKEGKYKISALLFLIICNNKVKKTYLAGKNKRVNKILEDIRFECGINDGLTGEYLMKELGVLTGTFVYDAQSFYHTIHDKLFDFLAYYFGTKNEVTSTDFTGLLIKRADYNFIRDRCRIRKPGHSQDTYSKYYLITIQDEYISLYIQRILFELTQSYSTDSFLNGNRNSNNKSFQDELSTCLNQLHKDKILALILTASSDFFCSMFVMNASDIKPLSKRTKNESEHYGIILRLEHLQKYIERLFDEMTKSNQVSSYMARCRCCSNETFRSELIVFIRSTISSDLIQIASTSFIQNMFVMKADDIYPSSPYVSMHYGIEIPGDLIQVYCEKVFNEMTSCSNVRYYIDACRCSRNKDFEKAIQSFMSQISLTRVTEVIKNASSSFVQNMFVVSEEDIKPISRKGYMRYGLILTSDVIQDYIERVFNDMTSSDYVENHIKRNRNRRNAIFYAELLHHMTQLDKTKIESLIKKASQDFIYQLCVMAVDDINETSYRECERYGVIVPYKCIRMYVDRCFKEMEISSNILALFEGNRNKDTSTFKTALTAYFEELKEEQIVKLIQTASDDFVLKMFVMTKKDIRKDSIKLFEHYGIVLQDKYLDIYTNRILCLKDFEVNTSCNRVVKIVLKCMSQLSESRITDLIQTANKTLFHQMITVDVENKLELERTYPECQTADSIVQNVLEMKKGLIKCPCSLTSLYIDRMISDWHKGNTNDIFTNKNLKNLSFVDKFLDHLNLLEPLKISELLKTNDNILGFTFLIISCKEGKVNLAKWCLEKHLHENIGQEHNRLFALFLIVVFNNQLEESNLNDEFIGITERKFSFRNMHHIGADISAKAVKEELNNFLQIIGVCKTEGVYSVRYNEVFHFLVFYFATIRHMSTILAKFADENFLCKWFLGDKSSCHQKHFTILLPDEELLTCINRVFTKLKNSEKLIRYEREGDNTTYVNSIPAYVSQLNKKEVTHFFENPSIDFIKEFFVITGKEKTKNHSDEESILSIVLLDDSTPESLKRIFDHISNNDCVEACLKDNKNKKTDIFHTRLLKYMKNLNKADVERLIQQASSDFINRMLIISEEDIKDNSSWEYERYGIVVPEDLLQMYIERVFSDMKQSFSAPVNRNSESRSFKDALYSYISSFSDTKLMLLLETASSKLIRRMYLLTEGEYEVINTPRHLNYYMCIPSKYFRPGSKTYKRVEMYNTYFLEAKYTTSYTEDDPTSFTIITNEDRNCEVAMITVKSKMSIENLQQPLSKYIDPMFTSKLMDIYVKLPKLLVVKYMQRMFADWMEGHVHDVFGNINLSTPSFRSSFLKHLKNIETSTQAKLSETTDNQTGDSALAVSCRVGIIELVEWCLVNNADTNSYNKYKEQPLYIACIQNRSDIVYSLLNYKNMAAVNECSEEFGIDSMYETCKSGHVEIVSMLLKANIDVNGRSNIPYVSETPLYVACKYGYNEIVSLLLDRKANLININKGDEYNKTPLYIACKRGHTQIVSMLLNHNSDDVDMHKGTNKNETPLYAACKGGYTDIVFLLLTREIIVINKSRIDGASPLWIACRRGHSEVVSTLLNHNGIEIDKCMLIGMSSLFIASLLGHTEIVKKLLERRADANICVKKTNIVMQLFGKFEINSSPKTLCFQKYIKYIRKLVIENASPHVKSYIDGKEEGWVFKSILAASPLHMGSLTGHIEIVKLLVERSSNINCLSENWSTPLFLACELGHEDIVNELLKNGADLTLNRKDGKSPLTIARDNGHMQIVEIVKSHTVESSTIDQSKKAKQ